MRGNIAADDINTGLCRTVAQGIVSAGGAGVFEATPCPHEALGIIAFGDSERMDDLRKSLGVVGVTNMEDGLQQGEPGS